MEPRGPEQSLASQERLRTTAALSRAENITLSSLLQSSSETRTPPKPNGNTDKFQTMHASLQQLRHRSPMIGEKASSKNRTTYPEDSSPGKHHPHRFTPIPSHLTLTMSENRERDRDSEHVVQTEETISCAANAMNHKDQNSAGEKPTSNHKGGAASSMREHEQYLRKREEFALYLAGVHVPTYLDVSHQTENVLSSHDNHESFLSLEESAASEDRPPPDSPSCENTSGLTTSRNPLRRDTRRRHYEEFQKGLPSAEPQEAQEPMAEPHGGFPKTCEEFTTEGSSSTSSWSQQSSSESEDSDSKHNRRSVERLSHNSHRSRESDSSSYMSSDSTSGSSSGRHTATRCQTLKECRDSSLQLRKDQCEKPETFSVFGWLTSVLTSWLPEFMYNGHDLTWGQGSEMDGGQFHDFDVRNVLGPSTNNWWQYLELEARPCPHSCTASRCSFRRTLEKWRQQLMLMTEAADTSAAVQPSRGCVFCHKDCQCEGQMSCQTMQVAKKIWRIVLKMKQSDLESSSCPQVNTSAESNLAYQTGEGGLCGLGHRHSCPRDYIGCNETQNVPSENENEATCVHILLNDLDRLLGKCEQVKKSSSITKVLCGDSDDAHVQEVLDEEKHQQRVPLEYSSNFHNIQKQSKEGSDPLLNRSSSDENLVSQERTCCATRSGRRLDLNVRNRIKPASKVHNEEHKSRGQIKSKPLAENSLTEELEKLSDFSFSGIKIVEYKIGGKPTKSMSTQDMSSSSDNEFTTDQETAPTTARSQSSSTSAQLSSALPGQNTLLHIADKLAMESNFTHSESTHQRGTADFRADSGTQQTTIPENVENIRKDNTSEGIVSTVKGAQALTGSTFRCTRYFEEGLNAGDFPKRDDYFKRYVETDSSPAAFPRTMSVSSSVPQINEPSFELLAIKQNPFSTLQNLESIEQACELYGMSSPASPSSQSSLSSLIQSEPGSRQQQTSDSRELDTDTVEDSYSENAEELQTEKGVIVAIESIIADLNLIKEKGPLARFKSLPSAGRLLWAAKRVKSVTFAQPLFVQRSLSLSGGASDRSLKSSSVHCSELSTSSSSTANHTISSIDFRMKQAFDQLDKVVDDVLHIIQAVAIKE